MENKQQDELVEISTTVTQEKDSSVPTADGQEASEQEQAELRHVIDKIPKSAWLVTIVEIAERFTYYGLTGPFRKGILAAIPRFIADLMEENYIQNKRDDPLRPGALGLGQSSATALSYAFTFWVYVTPIIGALIADCWLGRYKTICLFTGIYMTGVFILFATSLPVSLDNGAGLPGFIAAIVTIGLGAGGIKSNINPLLLDQYTETSFRIKTLKTGERVVVDPQMTVSTIYMIYWCCLCIGCLSGIATTQLEHHIDFWAAFLLPFCFFWLAVAALIFGKNYYAVRPTNSKALPWAFRAFGIAIKNGFKMESAKPSHLSDNNSTSTVPWDDHFIDQLKRGLMACKVLLPTPLLWLCYLQMTNNLVSQAGQMETHGIPNDFLYNITLIIEIALIPVFAKVIYPTFARFGLPLGPIIKVTCGFFLAVLGTTWAAIVQKLIYSAAPCYDAPLTCEASLGGRIPNQIHVMVQLPTYFLMACAEIMFAITLAEFVYTKAPTSMKSIVFSLKYFSTSVGSMLGMALSPVSVNPKVLVMYSSLTGVLFLATIIFYFCFRHYDKIEKKMFLLDKDDKKFQSVSKKTMKERDDRA